jgi:predicted nucleic acid-binding protein
MTVKRAWDVSDRWLQDSRVGLRREPDELGELFRAATAPFALRAAPKALGDCYLLALSQAFASTLVTFDAGLADLAAKRRHPVVLIR